jgi:hypothetical protein
MLRTLIPNTRLHHARAVTTYQYTSCRPCHLYTGTHRTVQTAFVPVLLLEPALERLDWLTLRGTNSSRISPFYPPPAQPRTERQAAVYSQRKRKLDLTLRCCCRRRKVSPRPSPRPTSSFSRDHSSPKYVEHRARTSTRDVLMFLFFSSLLNDADVTVKHQPKWQ